MISHGKDIKVFCGIANRLLTEKLCSLMWTNLGEADAMDFTEGTVLLALY